MVLPKEVKLPPYLKAGNTTSEGTFTYKTKINMKPKVELIEVADESTYTKPDWTVLIGMIVMVVLCGIILTVTNVLSVMY